MGPSFWELARQALSSTQRGYDLLAPKFESTPYATPTDWIEAALLRVEERYPVANFSDSMGADLACGTGRGTRALRRYCRRVKGFDFSSGMLCQARALSLEQDGLQWILSDLSKLKLESEYYDRIITFGAWGHILPSFRDQLLTEVLEGLSPGGVFLTLTANEPKLWEKRFWQSLFFDLAIKIRNLIWFHEFHMYYRLNSTERLLDELQGIAKKNQGFEIHTEPLPGFEETSITLLTVRRN